MTDRLFDRSRLKLLSLSERDHNLSVEAIKPLVPVERVDTRLRTVAHRIRSARAGGSSVVFIMGAHVLRDGVQRYVIDMMERGLLSCIVMNGAGVIHDFEFSLIGATTESVARYIKDGRFGFWKETGRINDIVSEAARNGQGLGESVGRVIEEENLPFKDTSLLAAGYRLGIPVTVHVGIGYDIVHQHPNCDPGAYGSTSYSDFLRFAGVLESLQHGVVMNFGSAVMGPEIFLKALSMVRNVAAQKGDRVSEFTTLVCDLVTLPDEHSQEASNDAPEYYFRPWKTLLVRTVAGGGESYYVRGSHAETIPQIWTSLTRT
jgi:hypothetical protein